MNAPFPIPSTVEQAVTKEPPPVYAGEAMLLHWGHTARRGMTVDLCLRSVHDMGSHPFKGLPFGPSGQRLRFAAVQPENEAGPASPVYEGEAMLMRWADDCAIGMMVRILLDKGPDGTRGAHPFDGLHAGRRDGENLAIGVWAVAEDERVLDPRFMPRKRPFHLLDATQQAVIICRDARFSGWLRTNLAQILDEPEMRFGLETLTGFDFATEVLRRYCGVRSRSELKLDTSAGERSRGRLRRLLRGYDEFVWGSAAAR